MTAFPAARPFLKWVGGKRQLWPAIERHIARHVPKRHGVYHEPFVGGGAVFFYLQPSRAVLSDSNERLVRTYQGIKTDVEGVIARLSDYTHDRRRFLRERRRDIDRESDADVAAWLIYLNRTGYNGLYRVNAQNRFNVPFGRYVRPKICDPVNLKACSKALASADLRCESFDSVADRAERGDFVYFDPPYFPLSSTASFTSYTSGGFDAAAQERLRDLAAKLKRRGVHVLLSNSATPTAKRLYASAGFRSIEVPARRMVNSRADRRSAVPELLIW